MRLLFALILALAPAASAQTANATKISDVPHAGAPQTFLFPIAFSPDAVFKALTNRSHPGSDTVLSQITRVERYCAAPLLEYKADPSVDPKMAIRVPRTEEGNEKLRSDGSMIPPPLPACTVPR